MADKWCVSVCVGKGEGAEIRAVLARRAVPHFRLCGALSNPRRLYKREHAVATIGRAWHELTLSILGAGGCHFHRQWLVLW